MKKINSYKDLDVWKKGIEIVDLVYKTTDSFPKKEIYSLSQHIQRTAISIPANISEGFARQHLKEYLQFCHIALGSCAELETLLVIASRRNYINDKESKKLEEIINHESRMIMNLVKSLKKRKPITDNR
ncbi:four helix bundle protein [Chlamydiota bacterium]